MFLFLTANIFNYNLTIFLIISIIKNIDRYKDKKFLLLKDYCSFVGYMCIH